MSVSQSGMQSFARILVFVEMRAVETGEAMRIVGKMPGHPVEDHADPFGMAARDEFAEIVGVP